MDSITPGYYAVGEQIHHYDFIGRNFDLIPSNAIGILADSNERPLAYIDTASAGMMFDIIEKSNTTMAMEQHQSGGHGAATYVGAIVSQDRETIYWVNNTRPLP